MSRRFFLGLSAGLLFVLASAALAAGPSGYHINKTAKVGGDGGWDYLTVDSKARRVYISRSTHVMVLDADTAAVVGDIPNTNGVHGIAIAGDMDKGFISDGRDGNVTIFDTKTLKVVGTAPAGKNPDAIIYDPASKRVFAFNGSSKDATAIDAKTGTVAGTIPLGGKPEFAAADEKGHVFVNIEDTSEIVQFDSNKLAVENRWKIAPGQTVPSVGVGEVIITQKAPPVDEVFDTRQVIGSGGGQGGTDFLPPETWAAMKPVYEAYRAAHNGQWQTDFSELQPYARTPEQQAALQKLILRNSASK